MSNQNEENPHNLLDPFSGSFNRMKMRYTDYGDSIDSLNFIPEIAGSINVFIDLESVFLNLSVIQDLEKKLILQQGYQNLFVSNILNLAAHYRHFFAKNTAYNVRVYMYYTDFDSTEFYERKYNEDFRSYYLNKFNSNPKFVLLTESLKEDILPQAKLIADFIPGVYVIKATNIEGALVPYIVATSDPDSKNFVISEENYNTQYTLMDNFIHHLIKAGQAQRNIYYTIMQYLVGITNKAPEELIEMSKLFSYPGMYCSLLACLGDRSRAINGIRGIGVSKLAKLLIERIRGNNLNPNAVSPETISPIFEGDPAKEEFENNYYCTSIPMMYERLTEADKQSIYSQIVDRYDFNSVVKLNNSRFVKWPLKLDALF